MPIKRELSVEPPGICDAYMKFQACPDVVESDPDVDGPGILAAFIIVAAINLVVAATAFLSGAFEHLEQEAFDKKITAFCRNLTRSQPELRVLPGPKRTKKQKQRLIVKMAYALSDQMLVNGFAVLIVAFAKRNTMTAYHFSILSDLAWLASNAHQTSMLVLAVEFRKGNVLRLTRVLGMLLNFGLLMAASVLEGNVSWAPWNYGCTASCLFLGNDPWESIQWGWKDWLVVNVILLTWGYGRLILLMFKAYDEGIGHWEDDLNKTLVRWTVKMRRGPRTSRLAWIGDVIRGICRFELALLDSFVIDFVQQIAWFGLGIYYLFQDKAYGNALVVGTKSSWGVGQILPMILLLVNVLAATEYFSET